MYCLECDAPLPREALVRVVRPDDSVKERLECLACGAHTAWEIVATPEEHQLVQEAWFSGDAEVPETHAHIYAEKVKKERAARKTKAKAAPTAE